MPVSRAYRLRKRDLEQVGVWAPDGEYLDLIEDKEQLAKLLDGDPQARIVINRRGRGRAYIWLADLDAWLCLPREFGPSAYMPISLSKHRRFAGMSVGRGRELECRLCRYFELLPAQVVARLLGWRPGRAKPKPREPFSETPHRKPLRPPVQAKMPAS